MGKRKSVKGVEREKRLVWAFPSKSRCPRCGTINTKMYSSNQNIQYRKCMNAVCRNTYKVIGVLV